MKRPGRRLREENPTGPFVVPELREVAQPDGPALPERRPAVLVDDEHRTTTGEPEQQDVAGRVAVLALSAPQPEHHRSTLLATDPLDRTTARHPTQRNIRSLRPRARSTTRQTAPSGQRLATRAPGHDDLLLTPGRFHTGTLARTSARRRWGTDRATCIPTI